MKLINLVLALGVLAGCATESSDAGLASTTTTTVSESAPSAAVLGVFRGTERPGEVAAFEAWIGRRVGFVLDYVGAAEPGASEPWAGIDHPARRCQQWGGYRDRLVLSVAILPNSQQTLRRGAAGDYDAHWRRFGSSLVANGCAGAVLRLGWEFNGRFYPWAAGGREAEFVAYWRRIVSTLREVPDQAFTYEWSVLPGNTNADVEAAYPGDDVVDIIGLDAYDTSTFTSPEDRWTDQLDRAYGLRWHVAFAARHRKPMAFSEWGVVVRPRDELGGGDAPLYIERMIDWIEAHDVVHAIYFDVDARDAAHRISTNRFPMASAVFRRLAGELAGEVVPASGDVIGRRPALRPAQP